ncbi:isochorismatase family protein [Isoptericola aurantiacus]|uniref:isochorismatase family protein n=1 Tax=Isoptericola aurantiacus TaxID=3377839 RepID=UPI00383A2CC9
MTFTTLDPRTALVVVDLQAGILAAPVRPVDATDVLARSTALAAAFRARDLPVVLVRVTAAPDGADAVSARTDAARAAGPRPDRPAGWDVLAPELHTAATDLVVTKRTWGAFYGTDLDLQLRRRGVTQLVLAGIATSMGVESTARSAHEHGYHLSLVTDAMSDRSADAHEHSVTRIFPLLGETGTAAELLGLMTP